MKNVRVTPLGSMITTTALTIGAGTGAVIFLYVSIVEGDSPSKHEIVVGALIALVLALCVGLYFTQLVAKRVARIEEAVRKVAAGDFATPLPVDSSGQLGQLTRTFNEMQRRLAELDYARKKFIANASHELRTPIFSLGGFVELLEEEDPSPEERMEFVRTMRQQIDRLTKLASDLLDLSQLDAGGIEMKAHNVDLGALTREVAREFAPRVEGHSSQLELRTSNRPVTASADPDRVRQIIRILLDNALTHTPEGTKVIMTANTVANRTELTVSDEGPGIAPRIQGRIFERFYTANSSGGSGLGLAIASELAHRMQGRIRITSNKRFTAFTLELPPVRGKESAVEPLRVGAGA